MKINRFVGLAAIALLVVGVMGVISYKVFAQTRAFQSQDCGQNEVTDTKPQSATETDTMEAQCGDQTSPDGQVTAGEAESADGIDAATAGTPAITVEIRS